MTRTDQIINRYAPDFSLSPVRDDAIVVVFEITEFAVKGEIDVQGAPDAIRRHHAAAWIYPALRFSAPMNGHGGGTTVFRIDSNTGPLVVQVADLDEVLTWFDATFPDWRTKPGAYSKFAFCATDYTAAEMDALVQRERFWATLDKHLDGEA